MIDFLLVIILISALLSLLSYVYCWNDIVSGKPHIISLRQITSIMDREELNRLFGEPRAGYHYFLPPPMLQDLIRWRRGFFYRECMADGLCVLGAWYYLTQAGSPLMVQWFMVMAVLCQGINVVWSTILVRKWAHQIREEIENSDD